MSLLATSRPDTVEVMRAYWLIPVSIGVILSCSEQLDPEDVEDAEPADVLVSSGMVGAAALSAAVAIPNFVSMQYRAKRSELQPNIQAIRTAMLSYDASFDRYVEVSRFHPDSSPGKTQRKFTTGSAFDTLGWMPYGEVRGSYKVVVTSSRDFRVVGISDIDGDGVYASWTATKSINPTQITPGNVY
jgi:type II secretory pathway pseudopilin PulG